MIIYNRKGADISIEVKGEIYSEDAHVVVSAQEIRQVLHLLEHACFVKSVILGSLCAQLRIWRFEERVQFSLNGTKLHSDAVLEQVVLAQASRYV